MFRVTRVRILLQRITSDYKQLLLGSIRRQNSPIDTIIFIIEQDKKLLQRKCAPFFTTFFSRTVIPRHPSYSLCSSIYSNYGFFFIQLFCDFHRPKNRRVTRPPAFHYKDHNEPTSLIRTTHDPEIRIISDVNCVLYSRFSLFSLPVQ